MKHYTAVCVSLTVYLFHLPFSNNLGHSGSFFVIFLTFDLYGIHVFFIKRPNMICTLRRQFCTCGCGTTAGVPMVLHYQWIRSHIWNEWNLKMFYTFDYTFVFKTFCKKKFISLNRMQIADQCRLPCRVETAESTVITWINCMEIDAPIVNWNVNTEPPANHNSIFTIIIPSGTTLHHLFCQFNIQIVIVCARRCLFTFMKIE